MQIIPQAKTIRVPESVPHQLIGDYVNMVVQDWVDDLAMGLIDTKTLELNCISPYLWCITFKGALPVNAEIRRFKTPNQKERASASDGGQVGQADLLKKDERPPVSVVYEQSKGNRRN